MRTKFITEMILLSHKTHRQALDLSLFRIKIAFLFQAGSAHSSLLLRNSLTFHRSAAVTGKSHYLDQPVWGQI